MRGAAIPALVLLAALAGCGGGESAASRNEAEPKIKIANQHHEDLLRLRPGLQRLAMMRAIRATGNRCQRVDNAGYQEEHRNMRMWVAQCGIENKLWAVFIAPNGDVQVRNCEDSGRLSLPRCAGLPPAVPEEREIFKEGASDKAFRNEM
ncbi:MAG TPA: hypothetical protein VGB54_03110 [Allosphingosinicella sp.]|jgi:hypothetical protein